LAKRYKPRKEPVLEYLTVGGVLRWAEALGVPYEKYDWYLWKSFAEFADILEGEKQRRLAAKERFEDAVTEWLLIKNKEG
jgi:hypothetical protein